MINAATRELVRRRAGDRCEYCTLPQSSIPLAAFHVDHITARQHGGSDDPGNLALACHHCNLHKGPNLTGIDPDAGQIAVLFDPRRDSWVDHFRLQGPALVGLTSTGRATIRVLAMNSREQVEARSDV